MKKLIHIFILTGIAALAASCWAEDIPESGDARHQVESLTAVPGDEEVQLSWSVPEGWNPTDYIVFYTDAESQVVTLHTGGDNSFLVSGLTNGTTYNFSVQAVYGKLISNATVVSGQPATTRLPVEQLQLEAGDAYVKFAWTTPSMLVLSYTLSYYNEDAADDITNIEVGKDATEYLLEGLVNDKNYYFSLVANYAKGASEAIRVKAMPTKAVPYFLSSSTVAVDQPITFTFNTTDYPTATDVAWTFPDGTVIKGTNVLSGIAAKGTQTVVLSATIDGMPRTWRIEIEVREYVVYYDSWLNNGTYESPTYTCPVFSPDAATVYINTGVNTSCLYAFDVQTGELKWIFNPVTACGDVLATSTSMATVNPITGDIYFGTGTAGQFYAVNPDGTLKWAFTRATSMNTAPPAVNAAGTVVYIVDASGNVFALDAASGQQQWTYAAGESGYGLLVNGPELVIGGAKNIHFVSTADGTLSTTVVAGLLNYTGFAVSPDKTKAYFSAKTSLGVVDLNAHQLLNTISDQGMDNFYQPIVADNGLVFAGTKGGYVAIYSADLATVIHSSQPSERKSSTFNFSRPCTDSQNRFYIVAAGNSDKKYDSLVLVYDSEGSQVDKWSYTQNNAQNGCNLVDGVLYTVNQGSKTDGMGLFIGKYVGAERAAGWASHGGDICGSGCIK